MDFTSIIFWGTLLPALLLFLIANRFLDTRSQWRQNTHKLFILALSLLLLGLTSWPTLIIFVLVLCLTWLLCKWGLRLSTRGKKWLIALSIPVILSPLLYYKYAHFVLTQVSDQPWDTFENLIIPVGISFYSFQLVGFCVDTLLRQLPMPRFLDYLNFGAFFPQIVAGPIERRESLLPQLETLDLRLKSQNFNLGYRYIILGLFFKMVLADNIAPAILPTYAEGSALMIWYHNILFSLRIYFDFCGYGLTAWGIATCLGIKLMMNFWSPYTAGNITEFWRRWHISLTSWFRDYIYFNLGGSRTRFWALNILIVFSVSGLWHGANWTFIIWGALAGIGMIIHRLYSKAGWKMPSFLGYMLTMLTMAFIWMFFYTPSLAVCLQKIEVLLTWNAYAPSKLNSVLTNFTYLRDLLAASLVVVVSGGVILCEYISLRKYNNPYSLLVSTPAVLLMIVLIVFLTTVRENSFIYFNF